MPENVLVLIRDDELRRSISSAIRQIGWCSLDFADATSAFLCACGHASSLRAAIVDEAVGDAEVSTLLQRLRVLRPDLRTLQIKRERTNGRAGDEPEPSV